MFKDASPKYLGIRLAGDASPSNFSKKRPKVAFGSNWEIDLGVRVTGTDPHKKSPIDGNMSILHRIWEGGRQ